jgi:hypothetical protein
MLKRSMPVAQKMVLQVAVRDIGQLTDIERPPAPQAGLPKSQSAPPCSAVSGPRSTQHRPARDDESVHAHL